MWLYFLLAGLIALADQLFKAWIVSRIPLGEAMDFWPGVLHLTNLHNTGAAFSILSDTRWLLFGVSCVLILALVVFLARVRTLTAAQRVCAACVLGGALGNAIDRGLLGYVVDMFCLDFVQFAVFNVADCFITCGGILFCVLYFLRPPKASPLEAKEGTTMRELDRLRDSAGQEPTDHEAESH